MRRSERGVNDLLRRPAWSDSGSAHTPRSHCWLQTGTRQKGGSHASVQLHTLGPMQLPPLLAALQSKTSVHAYSVQLLPLRREPKSKGTVGDGPYYSYFIRISRSKFG